MYLVLVTILLATSSTLCNGAQVSWNVTDGPVSYFGKYTNVFGVGVIAHSSISDAKFQHTCAVLAAWLDNDQDGCTDSPQILPYLSPSSGARPVVAMFPTGEEPDDSLVESLENKGMMVAILLFDDEIRPECSGTSQTSDCVDATLEEVWHVITQQGYAAAWPSLLAERDSKLSEAMDVARGGKFETIPTNYPSGAWYTYDDETCEYECMATEYIYWGVNAYVGALQNQEDRIQDEWKFNTKQKLMEGDVLLTALITDTSSYRMPTLAPNGLYDAVATCAGGVGHSDGHGNGVIWGRRTDLTWLVVCMSGLLYFLEQ